MSLNAKWIWGSGIADKENTAVCFRRNFNVGKYEDTIIKISADTRYVLYINGREIGRGPIRSTIDRWFYDEYDISGDIIQGENLLAVRVWDYGCSTYQTIANKGGLVFSIPFGVRSKIQEIIITTGNPTISSTITKVTVQSGRPSLGSMISAASIMIKAVAAYMVITRNTLRRLSSCQSGFRLTGRSSDMIY